MASFTRIPWALALRARLAGLVRIGWAVCGREGGGYVLVAGDWYIGGVGMGKEIGVGEAELRRVVRDRRGLRIEAEMGKYILGKLNDVDQRVAVIGADARTGVARREILDVRVLGLEGQ